MWSYMYGGDQGLVHIQCVCEKAVISTPILQPRISTYKICK